MTPAENISPLAERLRNFTGARRTILIAVGALAILTLLSMAGPFWFPSYDDAFITLTSAQALWTGHIANFPEAAPFWGVTSPVHCAVVALLLPISSSPLVALWWTQVLGGGLYLAGLWRLTCSMRGLQRWGIFITGLLAGTVWHQVSNGLETGLAMACSTWLVVGLRDRAPWLPWLLGTAPWVRPEFGPLAGVLALDEIRRGGRTAWRPLVIIVLSAAPWAAALWLQTGSIAPTTLLTKLAAGATNPLNGYLGTHLIDMGLAFAFFLGGCGPICAGVVGIKRMPSGTAVSIGLGIIAISYTLTSPAQLVEYQAQRYLYAFFPFVIAGATAALPAYSRKTQLALVSAALLFAIVRLPSNAEFPLAWRAHIAQELPAHAAVLARFPVDTVVAVGDAGYLAYATRFPLIDIVGLKTPSIAAINRSRRMDMSTMLARVLSERRARVLVVWQGWDANAGFVRGLVEHGWRATDLRSATPPPLGQYRVVLLVPPRGGS